MTGRSRVARSLVVALGALSGTAHGAPMGFKDSVMTMVDFGPNWREAQANYAFTPRDALGAGVVMMRSDDYGRDRTFVEAIYTRLVRRWNLPTAQANVWFTGGVGTVTGNDFSGTRAAASPGVQVDFETTRVYAAAQVRLYRAEAIRHDFASARVGFSFYEADYDQPQPWLIVEARRMRELSERVEITPMLRVIHNRYFVELGINNARQIRANLMLNF